MHARLLIFAFALLFATPVTEVGNEGKSEKSDSIEWLYSDQKISRVSKANKISNISFSSAIARIADNSKLSVTVFPTINRVIAFRRLII